MEYPNPRNFSLDEINKAISDYQTLPYEIQLEIFDAISYSNEPQDNCDEKSFPNIASLNRALLIPTHIGAGGNLRWIMNQGTWDTQHADIYNEDAYIPYHRDKYPCVSGYLIHLKDFPFGLFCLQVTNSLNSADYRKVINEIYQSGTIIIDDDMYVVMPSIR